MTVRERTVPAVTTEQWVRHRRGRPSRLMLLLWAGLLGLGALFGSQVPRWLHLETGGPVTGLRAVPWVEPPNVPHVSDAEWAAFLRPHRDFMNPNDRSGISPAMFVYDEASRHQSVAKDWMQDGKSYPQARAELGQCLALDPERADCHKLLGVVYVLEGRLEGAAYEYQEYLRLAPDGPDAAWVRGFLEALERDDREAAVPWGVHLPAPNASPE